MKNQKQALWGALVALWQNPRRRTALFVWVQYSLPLVAAAVLLLMGAFYNVLAMQLGRPVQVSVLRLLFNTLKSARTYLLGDVVSDGVRNFYLFLVVGAVLLMLFFLISLAVSIFAVCTLWRVRVAVAAGDKEAAKQAKILFCAFVPNRVLLFVLQAAVLPLALFPELFSLVCSRFLAVSGAQSFYVRLNPVLLAVGGILVCLLVLSIVLRRRAGKVGLDLFFIYGDSDADDRHTAGDGESQDDANGGDEDCDNDAAPHTFITSE